MQVSGTKENGEKYVTCFQHPPVRRCGREEEHKFVAQIVSKLLVCSLQCVTEVVRRQTQTASEKRCLTCFKVFKAWAQTPPRFSIDAFKKSAFSKADGAAWVRCRANPVAIETR
eukprot:4294969-Pleurochrysis_carterae.AAC.1